jgi:hypothetical protein
LLYDKERAPFSCTTSKKKDHILSQKEWRVMERVFKESKNFRQAEEWDILQHISMTPEQRQEASEQLRHRVYGNDAPDVREAQHNK